MSKQRDVRAKLAGLASSIYDLVDDLDTDDVDGIVEAIRVLDPTRAVNFKCCGTVEKVPAELIYAHCSKCNTKVKLRCFGSHKDVYDVLYAARTYFEKQKTELQEGTSHEE